MTMPTEASLAGYIASKPELKHISKNVARFHARVRVDHPRLLDDGTVSTQCPSYHDLVAYQAVAERAHEIFQYGDAFIASGSVAKFPDPSSETVQHEVFVALRIGHDPARTRYAVDRSPSLHHAADQHLTASMQRPNAIGL